MCKGILVKILSQSCRAVGNKARDERDVECALMIQDLDLKMIQIIKCTSLPYLKLFFFFFWVRNGTRAYD